VSFPPPVPVVPLPQILPPLFGRVPQKCSWVCTLSCSLFPHCYSSAVLLSDGLGVRFPMNPSPRLERLHLEIRTMGIPPLFSQYSTNGCGLFRVALFSFFCRLFKSKTLDRGSDTSPRLASSFFPSCRFIFCLHKFELKPPPVDPRLPPKYPHSLGTDVSPPPLAEDFEFWPSS